MSAASSPAPERIAAIDVGSNSIRLSVAEYDQERGLRIIDEVKDQPRLATGIATKGALDPVAMERALATLKRMREIADRRGVSRIRAVATSAVREASNGPEFVASVRRSLGLDLEIADEQSEAALSYRSVAHHFPLHHGRVLVADIGGGSLELVGAVNGLVEVTASLPLGAVRLTELFLRGRRSTPREVRDLRVWARKRLKRRIQSRRWQGAELFGSGGTFTNLARMALARRGVEPGMVHGEVVATAEVEHLLEWLATKSTRERAEVPGLNPQRADIILAGLGTAAELLDLTEARSVRVSAYGFREGLLLEMVGNRGPLAAADPLRAMRELVDRCQGDRRHVEHVRVLALALFDRLGEALGADPAERSLLEAASLLHDVGQVVSYRSHHRHSYQLIMHADRLSLAARDRTLVALISRYHRKNGPRRKDEEFARLSNADQAVVRRLSGLLRVADGLDRGHTAAVAQVATRLTRERLSIQATPRAPQTDLSIEIWAASRKADVLEKVLGRRVVIEASPT